MGLMAVRYSAKYKRDYKACAKRGLDLDLLDDVVRRLRIPEPLELRHRDHKLKGNKSWLRECHISG